MNQPLTYQGLEVEAVPCPICKGEDFQEISALWKNNPNMQKGVLHCLCKKCGMLMINPQPSSASLKKYYDRAYRDVCRVANVITCNRKLEFHKAFVGNFLEEGKKRVLDIGCATGYFVKWAKDKGHDAIGSEFTKGLVEWGRKHWGLDVRENDIADFSEDEKFDLISIYHVLEHIPRPDKIIEECKKRLSNDGMLYIAVPTLEIVKGKVPEVIMAPEHISLFTVKHLDAMLERLGFDIVKRNEYFYGYTLLAKKSSNKKSIKFPEYKDMENHMRAYFKAFEIKHLAMEALHKSFIVEPIHGKLPADERPKPDKDKLQQQYDKSQELFRAAIKIFPTFKEAWMRLVSLQRHPEPGLKVAEEAIAALPNDGDLYALKGFYLHQLKKIDEAEIAMKKAFELKPNDENILIKLAYLSMDKRAYSQAAKYFRKAIEINPILAYAPHPQVNPDALTDLLGVCYLNESLINNG